MSSGLRSTALVLGASQKRSQSRADAPCTTPLPKKSGRWYGDDEDDDEDEEDEDEDESTNPI